MEIFLINWICVSTVCLICPLDLIILNTLNWSSLGRRDEQTVEVVMSGSEWSVSLKCTTCDPLTAADKLLSSEWRCRARGFIAVSERGRWRCSLSSPSLSCDKENFINCRPMWHDLTINLTIVLKVSLVLSHGSFFFTLYSEQKNKAAWQNLTSVYFTFKIFHKHG